MLSVLIPIYNRNVSCLVVELHDQLIRQEVEFEIILLDDASDEKYKDNNRLLKKLDNIVYEELPENIGRSRIRNQLVKRASHEYLLFLDCDSEILDKDFCHKYLIHCSSEKVVCGGTKYLSKPPGNKDLKLHWEYGHRNEALPLEKRVKNPYKSFKTNNFLIARSIFNQVCFDENIAQYGHEDTLFGYALQKREILIMHVSNPVLHSGLVGANDFLVRTREALNNLVYLYDLYNIDTEFLKNIRILWTYNRLRTFGCIWIIKLLDRFFSNIFLKNLRGSKPKLFFLSLYKLFYFTNIASY